MMMSERQAELLEQVEKMHAELSQLLVQLPNPIVRILAQSLVQRWLALQVDIIKALP